LLVVSVSNKLWGRGRLKVSEYVKFGGQNAFRTSLIPSCMAVWIQFVKAPLQFIVMGRRDLDSVVKFLPSIFSAPDLGVKFWQPGVVIKSRRLGCDRESQDVGVSGRLRRSINKMEYGTGEMK
jgi:hypothetical protein